MRFVDLEDPPSPLRVEPPLRILGMVSRPKDDALAALDAEDEQAALKQRLGPLIDTGRVTLRWLERATLAALQQEVDHGEDFHSFTTSATANTTRTVARAASSLSTLIAERTASAASSWGNCCATAEASVWRS